MTWYKVTIAGTDYESELLEVQVTSRENGVASAILLADNKAGAFWTDTVDDFDAVTVQMRQLGTGGTLSTQFAGTVREVKPYAAEGGFYTAIKCKGLGAPIEETHCKDTFGYTSNQPTLNTIEEILEDLVDNSINKSYSSANNTGYAITKTYIPTIDAALSIPFLNAPYQTCKSIIDLLCMLDTAYRAGATAGPHYFTDSSGNLRVKTIGTQQVDGGGGGGDWGKYYNGQAANTAAKLYEGVDFYDYALTKPSDQYANNVVLAFDLRKPAYDYWTDGAGCAALWGNAGLKSLTANALCIVGNRSLLLESNGVAEGIAYYPAGAAANWNVTAWGSEKTIPRLNFYMRKDGNVDEVNTFIRMSKNDTARGTDFYYCLFSIWTDPDNTWIHKSIPIGPYWASAEESRQFRWTPFGSFVAGSPSANWSNIDSVEFGTVLAGGDALIYLDDLHFSGKCIREAVDTAEVTAHNEHQHTILSRTPLDDTAVYSDDSGLAGQLCYAELLRRVTPPRTFTCTVPFKQALKPGEYFTVYAGKTTAGTYKLNGVDFRVTEYTHRCTQGCQPQTSLTMTDDVLNSFPLGRVDARAVLNEYLLENNSKATDMQGGEVDLLIPHLRKTY